MKSHILLSIILLLVSKSVFADKEVGNGQLVVVPRGHTQPVPYEVAASWETGKYRNFYKLPCMPGVVEPRARFNRDYACNAVSWIEQVKDASPLLYRRLIKAAETTKFNVVNNYILWKYEDYPAGEIDYKKYETAAYFNGEIVLSTLVMDKIGPMENVLTKEENQGYVIFHELINAVYPKGTVKGKLDLGRVFVNQRIYHQDKKEVMINLAELNPFLVGEEKDYDLLLEVLSSVSAPSETKDAMIFTVQNYLKTGKSLRESYLAYLELRKPKDFAKLELAHDEFHRGIRNSIMVSDGDQAIYDIALAQQVSSAFSIPLDKILKIKEYKQETSIPGIKTKISELLLSSLDALLADSEKLSDLAFANLYSKISAVLNGTRNENSWLFYHDLLRPFLLKTNFYELGDLVRDMDRNYRWPSVFDSGIDQIVARYRAALPSLFQKRHFDFNRTNELIGWIKGSAEMAELPPLRLGDRVILSAASDIFKVVKIKDTKKGFQVVFQASSCTLEMNTRGQFPIDAIILE